MKLLKVSLLFNVLTISSVPLLSNPQSENGPMLDHKPGEGTVLGNAYMHTIGHAVTDIPLYASQILQGDVLGATQKIVKFALYHNPVNLFSDFVGGQK